MLGHSWSPWLRSKRTTACCKSWSFDDDWRQWSLLRGTGLWEENFNPAFWRMHLPPSSGMMIMCSLVRVITQLHGIMMEWWSAGENRRIRRKTCISATSFHINLMWSHPGLNRVVHGEKPVYGFLGCGMVLSETYFASFGVNWSDVGSGVSKNSRPSYLWTIITMQRSSVFNLKRNRSIDIGKYSSLLGYQYKITSRFFRRLRVWCHVWLNAHIS